MVGRPTVFNKAVFRALVDSIRRGTYDWVAAEAAGISLATYYRWMARGQQGEEPWVTFAVEVRRARAQAQRGGGAGAGAEPAELA
jgi:hypothetical protein